jgi:cellulose synthase/poly-beta-1,6-N-acetylglucosamine synthase-like glycosyltransferase
VNNCIGAGNLKHFALFLGYAWISSALALAIFGWNYFFCADDNCQFQGLEVQLVRAVTGICIGTLLFTSSMLMNVIYGVLTGTGTIDRLKQKADSSWQTADEEAMRLEDILGTGSILSWFVPVDPLWPDFGKIHGYTTTEQLVQNAENA